MTTDELADLAPGWRRESYEEFQARLARLRPVVQASRQASILNAREAVKTVLYRALLRKRNRRQVGALLQSLLTGHRPHDVVLHHVGVALLVARTDVGAGRPRRQRHFTRCVPVRGPCRVSRTRPVTAGDAG